MPRAARTNVYLSFAEDWDCLTNLRGTCERQIAGDLGRIFAHYDIAFWTSPDASRIDGITIFFETGDPELWGAGSETVGLSTKKCEPTVRDGVITGASAIFQCGGMTTRSEVLGRGPEFCAGVAAHEIGHQLGLEHVVNKDDMMNAIYREGKAFGKTPGATTDARCRATQNDSELLWSALGESRAIY